MKLHDLYGVDVPEGKSGAWTVSRFTVDEEAARYESLRALFGRHGRGVPEGTYTRLARGSTIVMSDTPDEIRDHLGAIHQAKGRCLVVGLGLGMVSKAMLDKPEVEHVTVVEKSADVIQLVGPWLSRKFGGDGVLGGGSDQWIYRDGAVPVSTPRLTIVRADIFEWEPPKGEHWDCAWFDIWDEISGDNLPEMKRLHRKFARRATWKGSWCRERVEENERRWARDPWNPKNRSVYR